jgi:hypothetical protein
VVSIVGTDEVDLNRNHISWVSPLGRALMKSAAGDSAILQLPGGAEYLTVLEVCYERISVEPFHEPPGAEASAKRLPRRSHIQLLRAENSVPRYFRNLSQSKIARLTICNGVRGHTSMRGVPCPLATQLR